MTLPFARSQSALDAEIHDWIKRSKRPFKDSFVDKKSRRMWVIKYFSPKFLDSFMATKKLVVSQTEGFTWGDGVYVAPIKCHYSTMMYGRIGVVGYVDIKKKTRVFDASSDTGRRKGATLYQEWISHRASLFDDLTTTIHADWANRELRNLFRSHFKIDVTWFEPDQISSAYTSRGRDRWLVISDWNPVRKHTGPPRSSKIKACEWVVLSNEEFQVTANQKEFNDLVGNHIVKGVQATDRLNARQDLEATLRHYHRLNRNSPNSSPRHVLHLPPG